MLRCKAKINCPEIENRFFRMLTVNSLSSVLSIEKFEEKDYVDMDDVLGVICSIGMYHRSCRSELRTCTFNEFYEISPVF